LLRYALTRLASAIPTLLLVVALAFVLVRAAPGGPFDTERRLSPAMEQRLAEAYHLDEPLPSQFLRYLGGLLQGDLGPSYRYRQSDVSELIAAGFPVSLKIGGLAMLLAVVLGIAAGTLAALRQNRLADHVVMALSMTGISVPNFVVAPVLVLVFAVVLRWLPAGDLASPAHYVLPVIALALPQLAYIARLTRASMIDVLKSPYIRTARAQGLSERSIVLQHALKPTLLPVLSYLGPATAAILTGSVVIEQIFNLPGLGRFFVQGALNRDYTLVMGVVVFYGMLIVLFNFVVDLLYGLLDPRVRYR